MSTLKVDNLLNSAGNESPISVPGAAKAWVYFDGTAANITDTLNGYNVASITDNNPGDYTVVFTNAMSNTNYAVSISAKLNNGSSYIPIPNWNNGGPSLGSFRFQLSEAAGYSTTRDSSNVCFVVFGD